MKKEYSEAIIVAMKQVDLTDEERSAFAEIVLSADEKILRSIAEIVNSKPEWVRKFANNFIYKRDALKDGSKVSLEAILEKELQDLKQIEN